MLDRLPELIDPVTFAERGRELSGTLQLSDLPRLSEVLADNSGTVDIKLVFDMDGKIPRVSGKVVSTLWLECRNCLQNFEWVIESDVMLAVIPDLDQIQLLPDDYDPLLVEQEKIAIKDIIEDELLLSIPDFPRHTIDCESVLANTALIQADDSSMESKPDNPFAVLAKLKNTGD